MTRFIIPYFGVWPAWTPLFLASCERQDGFEWLLVGETIPEAPLPPNVRFHLMSFEEIEKRIKGAGMTLPKVFLPYKLCDYKPGYGLIFADLLAGAEFWGHCDFDLAYGDLSLIHAGEGLASLDVFSADDRSCGHFQIYRNELAVNKLFLKINQLDRYLSLSSTVGLDEPNMSLVLKQAASEDGLRWWRASSRATELSEGASRMGATIEPDGSLMGLAETGPFSYLWKQGNASQKNEATGQQRSFLYLHWFQWKDREQWSRLMEKADWKDKGLRLRPEEWPRRLSGPKAAVRAVLYRILFRLNRLVGGALGAVSLMDTVDAVGWRRDAEDEWARVDQVKR